MPVEVKTIGASGQISLGKENAGRTVTVEQIEDGVWMIKAGRFIPDNEMWLWEPESKARLDRGVEWAKNTPAKPTDLDAFEKKIRRQLQSRKGR